MASSIAPNCTALKQQYDSCFNRWYTDKFLRGIATPATKEAVADDSSRTECDELFKQYKACVWSAIESRNLAPVISDARRDLGDAFSRPSRTEPDKPADPSPERQPSPGRKKE